jgi:catechol 2,3-dioxygenase-like lactoylglutathione lyase family enzyme
MSITIEGCTTLLQVFDMPRSTAFYRDLLGFELIAQSQPGDDFDWGLLQLGNVELMLNTAYERQERPPAPDPDRIRAHGDTELYFDCADLDGAYAYLRGRGLDVSPPAVTSYGMKQLRLKDPDGYSLCLQWQAA